MTFSQSCVAIVLFILIVLGSVLLDTIVCRNVESGFFAIMINSLGFAISLTFLLIEKGVI